MCTYARIAGSGEAEARVRGENRSRPRPHVPHAARWYVRTRFLSQWRSKLQQFHNCHYAHIRARYTKEQTRARTHSHTTAR